MDRKCQCWWLGRQRQHNGYAIFQLWAHFSRSKVDSIDRESQLDRNRGEPKEGKWVLGDESVIGRCDGKDTSSTGQRDEEFERVIDEKIHSRNKKTSQSFSCKKQTQKPETRADTKRLAIPGP